MRAVSNRYHVSPRYIWKLIRAGLLSPSARIPGAHYRFDPATLPEIMPDLDSRPGQWVVARSKGLKHGWQIISRRVFTERNLRYSHHVAGQAFTERAAKELLTKTREAAVKNSWPVLTEIPLFAKSGA